MQFPELVGRAQHVLPELRQVRRALDKDPKEFFGHLRSETAAIVIRPGAPDWAATYTDRSTSVMNRAREAVEEVLKNGRSADLSHAQAEGLEAVVHTVGRPAIPVQNGSFPTAEPDQWWRVLDDNRAAVEAVLASVGRIEVQPDPQGRAFAGTGFVVAPGVVATNRHVVASFATQAPDGTWRVLPDLTARIDFAEELNAATPPHEFAIRRILGVGTGDQRDLAFLQVKKTSTQGRRLPAPLRFTAKPAVRKGSVVYVVGYPAFSPGDNSVFDVEAVFQGIYDVKRLQPGYVMGVRTRALDLVHDCSTLGGNSGSCVADLKSGSIVAIHRRGAALLANHALPLWPLRSEPFVSATKMTFA